MLQGLQRGDADQEGRGWAAQDLEHGGDHPHAEGEHRDGDPRHAGRHQEQRHRGGKPGARGHGRHLRPLHAPARRQLTGRHVRDV